MEPLYQGISVSGKRHEDTYIWTIDNTFQHSLHLEDYTHLLHVYILVSCCMYFVKLF